MQILMTQMWSGLSVGYWDFARLLEPLRGVTNKPLDKDKNPNPENKIPDAHDLLDERHRYHIAKEPKHRIGAHLTMFDRAVQVGGRVESCDGRGSERDRHTAVRDDDQ